MSNGFIGTIPRGEAKQPSKWEQFFDYAQDVTKGIIAGQADVAKAKIKTQQRLKELETSAGLKFMVAQAQGRETQQRMMAGIAAREKARKERPGAVRVFPSFREAETELNKLGDSERYIVVPVTGGYQIKPRTRAAGQTTFFGEATAPPVLDYSTMDETAIFDAVQAGDTLARQEAVRRGYLKR